jgi:mono/diheme cytochrome c family protein
MAKVIAITELSRSGQGRCSIAAGAMLILSFIVLTNVPANPQPATTIPLTLQETGLYANFGTLQVDPAHLAFSPQYPLWSDGATKRRWISLPPGTTIDGSDPDAWIFPVGTRFWKEFSFKGQKVETRYLERKGDGQWLYAAYAWSADGREAQLVPARGKRGAYPLAGGRTHTIPGVTDCKACHQGGPSEVLGFGTLQLSPERDPGAPHAELRPEPHVDLRYLVDRSLLVGLPKALLDAPPLIAAATATERAALGYLHGNCGHCHNERGPLQNIALFLRHQTRAATEPALASTIGQPVRKPAPGQSPDAVLRVEPGHPDRSGLIQRVSSRYPALQMPPLGTELIDDEAVRLLYRWIAEKGASSQQAHVNEEGE